MKDSDRGTTVLVMSSTRIAGDRGYADALRTHRIVRELRAAGIRVELVRPPGEHESESNCTPHRQARMSDGLRGHLAAIAALGPVVAIAVLVRALATPTATNHSRRVIVVHNDGWMTFPARLFQKMRPGTLLHLDLMGIAHQEVEMAGYRLWPLKSWFFKYSLGKAVKWATFVTTVNDAHAEFIRTQYGRKSIVIRDALEDDWFRKLISIPPPAIQDTVETLFVGSVSRGRLDAFVTAAHRAVRTLPTARFVVVGAGPDLDRYHALAVDARIQFVGYEKHEQLLKRFQTADICYSDVWSGLGFPYKLLEYLASGRAVLTQDTASVREMLTDRDDCILCGQTAESIYGSLRELVQDRDLRIRLSSRAKQKAIAIQAATTTYGFASVYGHPLASAGLPA